MNLKAGLPYSLIKYGLPKDYPKLEQNIKTDVVVLGGGISGALAAYHLVNAGVSCTLVDSRSIGLGSTCASTSLLQYEIDTPLRILSEHVGYKNAERAYKLCEEAIHILSDISTLIGFKDFMWKPSLLYAARTSHAKNLESEFHFRKKAGFEVNLLSSSELKKEYGLTAPNGILSACGAAADAYLLTHYLLQYSISKGLIVYDRTMVTSIAHHKLGIHLSTTNKSKISAKKMVFATGYETMDFLPSHIVNLKSTYAVISESYSLPPLFGKHDVLLWNTNDPYQYMRTTADRRILIGGRDENFYSPARRDKLIKTKAALLRKDFEKLFKSEAFIPEFSWTGTFGSTKDGLPYIGKYKKLPNTFFALGFGGNGITFSVIAARIITDMIQEKKNTDSILYSFGR